MHRPQFGFTRSSLWCVGSQDGSWSILNWRCTVVHSFTDLSYHSFMDSLKDFGEKERKHSHPCDTKLTEIPGCVLVAVLGVLLDVPVITGVALLKSPILLIKGWQVLVKDFWGPQGRESFLEKAVCAPFDVLAIVSWPLVVVASILASVLASPFMGLYGAFVVYQERSVRRGLAYIVNVLAQYDEYTNRVLHMNKGSCFPRPKYRGYDGTRIMVVGPPIAIEVGRPKSFTELQQELQQKETGKLILVVTPPATQPAPGDTAEE